MKACVLQPFYALDYSRSDELFAWELDALDKCDDTLDLIVLPEYADVPALASTKAEHFASAAKYTDILLETCRETARRCHATVFVNACSHTPTGPRNTTFAIDSTGTEVGRYDKKHLVPRETGKLQLDESYTHAAADPVVLTIDGIRYGFLTCYDFYFYESYAAIARQNIDILIGCSHQRSDTLQATELICRFCAYHTNAYVIRSSVCLEPGGNVGGGSMIVSPFGSVLCNMENRIGWGWAEFDPREKYFKPAGFGNPPAAHHEYIDQGRRPWQYRPAGSAICLPDKWMPYPRVCAWGGYAPAGPDGSLPALGAAVAMDAHEIGFDLADAETETILRKFSCHTVMNIRLPENPSEETLRSLAQLIYRYDCTGYVCVLSREEPVLKKLQQIAPWMILGFEGEDFPACCHKVLLPGETLTAEKAAAIHAAGKICMAFAHDPVLAQHCLALGADTVLSRDFSSIRIK